MDKDTHRTVQGMRMVQGPARIVVSSQQSKTESMEGANLRDLTAMLSSFMDNSGNIDPSKAPPDMAVCLRSQTIRCDPAT